MLKGQELGPFKIDKELGSGAMGSVYRGIYGRTGQKVAIKIMAPGLAANEQALRRFEREASILKQLHHPNIVRFFGAGKYLNTRYYAMEYVEGEALDRVMARRGRMTWEEVVAQGLQLCAALQHAHEKGVVHRDLKPSNLMVLRDGTLKLTDFGIAKDLDVTQLTEQNCTVGTAAYMSPEQCKGERNLTHKSDLYSLGVVFYELITGRKPFIAENAMDMFMLHVQGTFPRTQQLVMDVPIWMDNLICQLLEKKPEHRPFDAATVANALSSIQEKVEAQQSAGVDAARKRRIDRLNNEPKRPLDETEREMARTLVGKKTRKKKIPFYRTGWFVSLSVVALLGAAGFVLWLLLRPPAPEKLYASAERLMKSKSPDDWEKALDGPIKVYREHYAGRPGPETEQMLKWEKEVQVNRNEQLLLRYLSKKGKLFKFEGQTDAEKAAFRAIDAEEEGDLKQARDLWKQIQDKFGPGSGYSEWGQLARRHLELLDSIDALVKDFRATYDLLRERRRDPVFTSDVEKEAFRAFWYEWFDDPVMALRLFKSVAETYQKHLEKAEGDERLYVFIGPERFWRVLMAWKSSELKKVVDLKPNAEKDRPEVVKQKLEEANQLKERDKKYGIYRSIEVLYQQEASMKSYFEEAVKQLQAFRR